MRLEYTENEERKLRMTEIEAILENNLAESEEEKSKLVIELWKLGIEEAKSQ